MFDYSSLAWYPKTLPSSTTLTSVPTSAKDGAERTLTYASRAVSLASRSMDIQSLEKQLRGAQATLTVILAENAASTATDNAFKAQVKDAWFNATLNLDSLSKDNAYGIAHLSLPANIIYVVVFACVFLYFTLMIWKSRYHWFNVSFFCGYGLELAGFVSRLCSEADMNMMDPFICQFVVLTFAPVFIMAAIYYLLAELIVVYGAQYSLLRPMWFTYIFIVSDVTSLVIQAAGGGASSSAQNSDKSTHTGTSVMVAGIVFQVFSMTVFLLLMFVFLFRVYVIPSRSLRKSGEFQQLPKITPKIFLKLLFNTKSTLQYKSNYLENFYEPEYAQIRARPLFPYFPLAILVGTIFVYIRTVYRVVELAQGFSGYLIRHEVFLMVLDALMIAFCAFVFVPFHPYFALGPEPITVVEIKNAQRKARLSKDAASK